MIELKNFILSFNHFSLSVPSLSFPESGSVLLEGANGSGKSSLFRTLMKINTSYEGKISIGGRNLRDFSLRELSYLISYIPQISTNLPYITGEEFIQQGLYLASDNRLDDLIDIFEMQLLLKKNCHTMSGGEKQLCILVRNLAIKKPIIFLDEADSFLSKKNKLLLRELVTTLSERHLIIISSHQQELYHIDVTHIIEEINDDYYCIG